VIFPVKKKSKRFERCRSAGTLKNTAVAFLSPLMPMGVPLVGYLAGCLENPITLNHFNDVAYFRSIEDICRDYPAHLHVNVAKRYRNRGLGTALVGRFVEWAKLHSLEGIHLVTSSTARSIPFYRRSGFTELRTFPWNVGTSVCMGRKL
jgi:GNAT superfamily N-acetyltransferase